MTHPAFEHGIQPGPAGQPAVPNRYFEEEELKQFQRSDLGAGKVVIALITAIFVVGLLLYGYVAYVTYQS